MESRKKSVYGQVKALSVVKDNRNSRPRDRRHRDEGRRIIALVLLTIVAGALWPLSGQVRRSPHHSDPHS